MRPAPTFLARGPWAPEDVSFDWRAEPYAPGAEQTAAADAAITALRERSSPSHDGLATRLVEHRVDADGRLHLELQAIRWALRLLPGGAARSMTGQCVVRSADGRWLAGRRAAWVATWANRWTLGAGGAVDPGESPMTTLERELQEEWGVTAERLRGDALLLLPNDVVMFVGTAWLPEGAEVVRDHEHDEHDWWPADIERWPADADPALRALAEMVSTPR
ncbi:NUDIX hydrolase [Patulibacter brassicae]|jgi:8-oxo-dGTP pyrophosphatase MutT (NUDIX family)|uniref:NUDIX hydrolase n=1 Tax=Patulibacter brassicae TaxID=1705717 RepID=A0ABU4VLZ4_9ACTN|nr:NUDIX hydrolase [Patulibacter brassicae]MDX8151966.1 NUDIX hydrolase [Patulibacter brassicae]